MKIVVIVANKKYHVYSLPGQFLEVCDLKTARGVLALWRIQANQVS